MQNFEIWPLREKCEGGQNGSFSQLYSELICIQMINIGFYIQFSQSFLLFSIEKIFVEYRKSSIRSRPLIQVYSFRGRKL